MKKCIVVSTPGAKFAALAIKENFRHSLRKVAELGYDAVELHIRDPHEIDVDEVKELLEKSHLPVPTMGTGQAYGEEGLSLTDPEPPIRKKAVPRKPSADEAAHFGARLAERSGEGRREAVADLYWALLNSAEFAWNH